MLAAEESAVVLGRGSTFRENLATWTVEEKGSIRLRATYQGLRSNWVTVTVD